MVTTAPAALPPAGLPGLDPTWSRLVSGADAAGIVRTWHVLDSHAYRPDADVRATVLCSHGNPTWSYLWRGLLAQASPDVRVVAIDHLDMGYSERTGTKRNLAQRVDDLGSLTSILGLTGPVIVVAHDWGGPISLGWALDHRDMVAGVCLLNTAVHQPAGSPAPALIRAARWSPVRNAVTVATPTFIRGTTALSFGRLPKEVAQAYAAPYATAERRLAVGTFVADIPLEGDHPSANTLDAIAEGVRDLEVPALLLWGPGDPVFSDRYLHDLEERLPQAQVHRYVGARHLVIEDAPELIGDLLVWIDDVLAARSSDRRDEDGPGREPLWAGLERRAEQTPDEGALAESIDGMWRTVSWLRLNRTVRDLAAGLAARGVEPGDRVSVLIPPGADLVAVIYACWRIGASVVVTDTGLGRRGIVRALRSAAPDHVIAIPRGLLLVRSRAVTVPGRVLSVDDLPAVAALGATRELPAEPGPDDEALVAFTSGSTGPAKGVVYAHRQIERTRDLLIEHYSLGPNDGLVAAFAPWAVLGPALGIASAIPDMDLVRPDTLTAHAVAGAARQVGGTVMWASPAAFRGILTSASGATDADMAALAGLRLVMGAGAPVDVSLLHGMARLCPQAQVRTPYGMTEVLPVCDVGVEEIDEVGAGPGVLVGRPLPGVEVAISAVDNSGRALGAPSVEPGVLGEVMVRAAHRKLRYDRLWATERASSRDAGWHRTGDVGQLDSHGRLWIAGRLAHLITTAHGPLAPVAAEQAAQTITRVRQAACVGVGPVGCQVPVLVCVLETGQTGLADLDLLDEVRAVTGLDIAAVLLRADLPVDIRHRSKIDRVELARWADERLAGRR